MIEVSTCLFTGDSLFPGGVGKTWAPEDFTTLIDEVETHVHPGHGSDTTLGVERAHLAEWRERDW